MRWFYRRIVTAVLREHDPAAPNAEEISVRRIVAALILIALASLTRGGASADGLFTLSSPAFKDGDLLASTFAFRGAAPDGGDCGGQGLSPPLTWTNPPPRTQSFALVIYDIDGREGAGVVHWVAYDIAPSKLSVALGEGVTGATRLTNGTNTHGTAEFRGFCPPQGEAPHHYVMTVFALDLAPILAPGMTRDELLAAVNQHVLRVASIVGRYGR
jgi:Raf kinase inhibitor-like YbhB/YbcL family protein